MYRTHYFNLEKVYWIGSMWVIYSDFFQLFLSDMVSFVVVMHLVTLFWHSNDVFIRAHMETIEKFKKYMFRIMNMSLILILQWKHCYSGLASISTMRCGIYEDAMKEYGLGPNNEILHRVLFVPHCVVDVNTSPECQCHHRRAKVND